MKWGWFNGAGLERLREKVKSDSEGLRKQWGGKPEAVKPPKYNQEMLFQCFINYLETCYNLNISYDPFQGSQ